MKITPLEIRQKDFERKLRGYDKDEVNAFLQSLSNEWERVMEDNKELNLKLKQSEKDVSKLREIESSLYKTLKTAEDTGANVIEQANKAAELHMKEIKMNAEALLSESKNKARAIIEQAEMETRQIIEELQDAVKSIEQNHRDIENHRQNALQELKNLSVTLIEKVERNTGENKKFKFNDYVKRVKKLTRDNEERIKVEKTEIQGETSYLRAPSSKIQVSDTDQTTPTPSPPKTREELRNRIIKQKLEAQKQGKATTERKEIAAKNLKSATDETKKEPIAKEVIDRNDEVKKEKKGLQISKTVSFFDELDIDS